MAVVNGQLANQTTFNNAFMSRLAATTSTVAIVKLENAEVDSGATIVNLQKAVNKLFNATGVAGESDATSQDFSSNDVLTDGVSYKAALAQLDGAIGDLIDDLATLSALENTHHIAQQNTIDDHETRLDNLEGSTMSIGGDKTFTGNVVVAGNFEVQGTVTSINSSETEVEDASLTVNKGGTDGSSENAGLYVERSGADAAVAFDSTLTSKWKVGFVGAFYEVIVAGLAQTIAGLKTFTSGIATDTIAESTATAGVTIDGLLLKDGQVDGVTVSTFKAAYDTHAANTSNPHAVTKTQVGLSAVTNDAQLKRSANDFTSFTEKVTAVDNDIVLIEDSEDSYNKKKLRLEDLLGGAGTAHYVGSVLTLTNGGAIAIDTAVDFQTWRVRANAAGLATLDAATPFGGTSYDGQTVTVICDSNTNTVKIPTSSGGAEGVVGPDMTLALGQAATYRKMSDIGGWVLIGYNY